MKVAGIILVIIGGLNFIINLSAIANGYDRGGQFGFAIGLLVLGIFLIDRGNKKKKENQEKEKWKGE